MNASIPAALLMLLLAGGWWLGRRRSRPFLRSIDTTAVADLNRAQIERLQSLASAPASEPMDASAGKATAPGRPAAAQPGRVEPMTPVLPLELRDRRRCLRQLQSWMTGSREQRLQAMDIARLSTKRDVLPLLRLGLRDPDPAVMAAAAAAMVRFRGRSTAAQPAAPPGPLTSWGRAQLGRAATRRPRKVCRTR